MSVQVGIIGLPNAGKSTLFNALVMKPASAKSSAGKTGKHPFTTVEPNKGAVDVPDEVLDELYLLSSGVDTRTRMKRMSADKTDRVVKTPVQLNFVDIAGLIKGAHHGEGLGNQFLHHIREVDLILHVVREFEDETVAHIHEEIDPENDLDLVRTELILKDLETVEGQLGEKRSGLIREMGRVGEIALRKVKKGLDEGKMVREIELGEEGQEILRLLFLLTGKPEIVVRNCGERKTQMEQIRTDNTDVLMVCAKLEEELAGLPYVEQRQYLKEFGLPEPALKRIIRAAYDKLGLITFYTIAGGKEVRAWALPRGKTVYEAAGKIHTDMQKGFIKAEVIGADELLRSGSWKGAKEEGKVQLVGREYLVKDKDIIEIKFN